MFPILRIWSLRYPSAVNKVEEEALFTCMPPRPGDPPNVETARNLIQRLFFDEKRDWEMWALSHEYPSG